MPRFRQAAEILRLMNRKECIRNIGVVAHIDHGKTTMTDSLLAEAGLLSPQVAGLARALDYLEEEQKRGITIKTANVSLLHETEGQPYIINLVDTPGHVDFTGKVTRALRTIDGVIVVVDAVEEIMAQTETVTSQALRERVKPLLFINKVDRLIKELKLNESAIQSKFTHIINDFNDLIDTYAESEFRKKWKIDALKGTVVFGSALHKWGFTLSTVKQKGIKFANIADAYAKNKHETLSQTLPLHDAILDMATKNSPSPVTAQKYRVPKIWRGRLDSEVGQAMLNCDERGPTVMCITNVQIDPRAGLIATGRLFSGSVQEEKQVYLVGTGKKHSVKHVSICMSAYRERVNRITAGNIAALEGLDDARGGETLVDFEHKDAAMPFEQMRYVSEPVATISIEPRNPEKLTCLVEAMNRLSIEDQNLTVTIDERTGEYLLSGMGELHLETALAFLRNYSDNTDIVTSNPTADYQETVIGNGLTVMAISPNKQNSLRLQVEPARKKITRSALHDMAGNVWATDERGNALISYVQEGERISKVKDAIIQGFLWACKTGPLCEQPLRNLKVKIVDAQIHEDPAKREPIQIMRATSRAIFGSILTAKPTLLEPIYRIEISTPTQWFGTCTRIITSRRGKIQATKSKGMLTIITGYIPVAETFGLTSEMRSATSGHAFWQSTFAQWRKAPIHVAAEIVKQIRTRKGLPPEVPKPDLFIDKTCSASANEDDT